MGSETQARDPRKKLTGFGLTELGLGRKSVLQAPIPPYMHTHIV